MKSNETSDSRPQMVDTKGDPSQARDASEKDDREFEEQVEGAGVSGDFFIIVGGWC